MTWNQDPDRLPGAVANVDMNGDSQDSGASRGSVDATANSRASGDFPDVRSLVEAVIQEFSDRLFHSHPRSELLTGYTALDQMTGGLQPGKLHVIASKPAGGKTTLLLNILEAVCTEQKAASLLFCPDLAPMEIISRMVFGRASFPLEECKGGNRPSKACLDRIQKACIDIGLSDLRFHDGNDPTLECITAVARKAHASKPLGFIAIDNLHRIKPSATGLSAKAALAQTVSCLKNLARELNVPVCATAHLKKSAWHKRAGMEDLRHGSVLAHEADFIGILQPMVQEDGFDYVGCSVVKSPNGRLGDFDLYYASCLQRFCKEPVLPAEEREMMMAWNDYLMEKNSENRKNTVDYTGQMYEPTRCPVP